MTPFGANNMMRSAFTQWLTAGRFMRAFYGWAKAAGFVFLTGLEAWRHHDATGTFIATLYGQTWYTVLGWFCVWAAVVLTVVRALPVLYDSTTLLREHDRRSRASSSL
jgi:hypothetical protein